MKLSHWILACALPAMLLMPGCGETVESTWIKTPLVVDGNGKDWSYYPLFYNEDLNLVYGFANNDSTLYCMIRFNDQHLARMMAARGFTFWLNNADDEEKLLAIHYQEQHRRGEFPPRAEREHQPLNQENNMRKNLSAPKGRFTVAQNDTITDTDIKNIDGLKAVAGLEDGLFCYEFSIALNKDRSLTEFLDCAAGTPIKAGMVVAGVSEEDRERMREEMAERREAMGRGRDRMRGGRDGGMGGFNGGGPQGGRRGGAPHMPNLDGEEFWITVKLAKQ